MMTHKVLISLGSNLGDRALNIQKELTLIQDQQGEVIAISKLYASGDLKSVESFCEVLLAAYPDSAVVYNVLGVALEGQGRSEEALLAYEKTNQKNPGHLDARHNAGVLLSKLGRFEEAREKYIKIIEQSSKDGDAYNNLAVILQKLNQHRLAASYLQKAVVLQPGNASTFFNYANSLRARGER